MARTCVPSLLIKPEPLTIFWSRLAEDCKQSEVTADQNSATENTYPSPGGSTTTGAAPQRTRTPQSECAGRGLRRASRNSCTTSCTGGKSAEPCTSAVGKKWRYSEEDIWDDLAVNRGWTGEWAKVCIWPERPFPRASLNTCHPLDAEISVLTHRWLVSHVNSQLGQWNSRAPSSYYFLVGWVI